MKDSRKYAVIGLLIVALFFAGAIIGSYAPNIPLYLIITTIGIAAAGLIVFGYTGNEKSKIEKKNTTTNNK